MPPHYLGADGFIHLSERFRFVLRPETPHDFIEFGGGEPASGPQQNSIAGFFNDELHTRLPSPRGPDILG
jgi:hypothetical protein